MTTTAMSMGMISWDGRAEFCPLRKRLGKCGGAGAGVAVLVVLVGGVSAAWRHHLGEDCNV